MVSKPKVQKLKPESAEKFLRLAKDDLYVANILSSASKCRPETILFHVQQAIEKAIKSVLIRNSIPIILTHDIDHLIGQIPNDLQKNIPEGGGELTLFATIRRYEEGDEIIEKEDIQVSLELGQKFITWAES